MNKADVISDVFTALHIRSDLYFRAHLGDAMAVRIPEERRRIRFHLLLQGACRIAVEGAEPVPMTEGDVVLVPNGASQILSTAGATEAVPLERLLAAGMVTDGVLSGGGPARAVLLCGFCQFDEGIDHPALSSLPAMIPLSLSRLGAEPWIAATLKLLELEANLDASGTRAILGRLIEIIVIQATRRLTETVGEGGNGFIAALADPSLSRALQAIHSAPERPWRVGDLAAETGMSRSRFAQRFADIVGVPPMVYMTKWRLARARALLADTQLSIDEIARRCGYASLPSFSRRFKMQFGIGPGAFRRSGGADAA